MVYKLQQNPATEGLPRSAGAWNRCADFPAYLPPGSVGHRYTRIQIWGRVPASSFGSGLKGKPLRAVQCVQGAFQSKIESSANLQPCARFSACKGPSWSAFN